MPKAKRTVIARSKHLYLTFLTPDDAPSLCKWINDPQVYGHLRDIKDVKTTADQANWIREAHHDPSLLVFAIYYLPEDRLIGYGGFKNILWEDRIGEIWRIIGETEYHGKGLGTELYRLLCKVGFEVFAFQNILAEHYANNPASLKSALKAGARHMGTRRQARRSDGKYLDIHYTDILPHELTDTEDIQIRLKELPTGFNWKTGSASL
jgi:ribosomal-protein-alanine N-acetyltransferase